MADDLTADVVIVGNGMVGGPLALALADSGFRIALIDGQSPAIQTDAAHDGRASAIALGSARILAGLGLWEEIAPVAGPIEDIRVSDGPSRLFLHYNHRAVGDEPLGYIVENRDLRRVFGGRVARHPGIMLCAPGKVATIERDGGGVTVALEDGRRISAALLVGADGRNSAVRGSANIAITRWSYPQTALVCAVRLERPHRRVAHERFLPAGPFAVLPCHDQHRASIVWTEKTERTAEMLALDDAAFSDAMGVRFGPALGRLTIEGRRWTWPLGLHHAARYVDRRLVLVGDAAHGIHPIAGQGLNLGLRDVAALAETLVDARRLGLDPGAGDPLARYERWRRPDNVTLLVATDALNRLFSTDFAPLRIARDLGLAAVDRIGPLKSLFMRQAMGVLGHQPRLARGERL